MLREQAGNELSVLPLARVKFDKFVATVFIFASVHYSLQKGRKAGRRPQDRKWLYRGLLAFATIEPAQSGLGWPARDDSVDWRAQGRVRGRVHAVDGHRPDPEARGRVHRAARRAAGALAGHLPVRGRLLLHQELPAALLQRHRRQALRCPALPPPTPGPSHANSV